MANDTALTQFIVDRLPENVLKSASLMVCAHSADKDEAVSLLEMLGLV